MSHFQLHRRGKSDSGRVFNACELYLLNNSFAVTTMWMVVSVISFSVDSGMHTLKQQRAIEGN